MHHKRRSKVSKYLKSEVPFDQWQTFRLMYIYNLHEYLNLSEQCRQTSSDLSVYVKHDNARKTAYTSMHLCDAVWHAHLINGSNKQYLSRSSAKVTKITSLIFNGTYRSTFFFHLEIRIFLFHFFSDAVYFVLRFKKRFKI